MTNKHPKYQVGEEVFIKIPRKTGIVLEAYRTSEEWKYKVRFLVESMINSCTWPVYKEDYVNWVNTPTVKEFSEKSLAKVFDRSIMSFNELLEEVNR